MIHMLSTKLHLVLLLKHRQQVFLSVLNILMLPSFLLVKEFLLGRSLLSISSSFLQVYYLSMLGIFMY